MSRNGGLAGMQYNKKSFSVMGDNPEVMNVMTEEERVESDKVLENISTLTGQTVETKKKIKHILPFGDRILVRRRVIGEKLGSGILYAPDDVEERKTDLADVVFVPELSFADKEMIDNAEEIIKNHLNMAKGGDAKALEALIDFNDFIRAKLLKPGDAVMLSKYVGINFSDTYNDDLTLVDVKDIIGVIKEDS